MKLEAKPREMELHPVPNADREASKLEQRQKHSQRLGSHNCFGKAHFGHMGGAHSPTVKLGLAMKGEQRGC